MNVKEEIWSFAIENSDYWELLRLDTEPAEVAALTEDEKAAFNAARREVQRRYLELVRACNTELGVLFAGTVLESVFKKKVQEKSILQNKARWVLPSSKGDIYITAELGSNGKVCLFFSIYVTKGRASSLKMTFNGTPDDENSVYFEQPMLVNLTAKELAKRLVEPVIKPLLSWVNESDREDSEDDDSAEGDTEVTSVEK